MDASSLDGDWMVVLWADSSTCGHGREASLVCSLDLDGGDGAVHCPWVHRVSRMDSRRLVSRLRTGAILGTSMTFERRKHCVELCRVRNAVIYD